MDVAQPCGHPRDPLGKAAIGQHSGAAHCHRRAVGPRGGRLGEESGEVHGVSVPYRGAASSSSCIGSPSGRQSGKYRERDDDRERRAQFDRGLRRPARGRRRADRLDRREGNAGARPARASLPLAVSDPVHLDRRRRRARRCQPARRPGWIRQGDRRPHDPDPRTPRQPAGGHDVEHRREPRTLGRADLPPAGRRGNPARIGACADRRRSRGAGKTWRCTARLPRSASWSRSTRCSSTCAKALKRARLWDPDTRIERKAFPTLARITKDQRETDTPLEEIEERIRESYETRLY